MYPILCLHSALGTKYNWNEATAAREVKLLNPAVIQEKVPAYAAILKERHGSENWQEVLHATSLFTHRQPAPVVQFFRSP